MNGNSSLIKRLLELNSKSVTVKASTTHKGQQEYLLLNDQTKFWLSESLLNSYFIINFKNIYANVNSYSLLFYPFDHYPLSWEIKGSIDGQNWFFLDKQEEDLCSEFAYKVSSTTTACGRNVTANHSFARPTKVKYIKVQQIGENSGSKYDSDIVSAWHKAFYLSGIELYGSISFFLSCKTNRHNMKLTLLIMTFILS